MFLDDDIEAVLDYERERALACPGCGLPRDETMDPAAQAHFKSRVLQCFACAERERTARQFTAGRHDGDGVLYTIERLGSIGS